MAPVRILLVRHGQTSSNVGGAGALMSGWADLPLSAEGVRQVERLRRRLAREAPFAAIYASPLARALGTARPLEASGLGPLRLCPDLREIGCGRVDGLPLEEVRRGHPDLWAANLRQDDDDFRWPGGESYRELRARVLGALGAIAFRHPGERVLVVSHAGPIGQIVGSICGERPARWDAFRPGNASMSWLDVSVEAPESAPLIDLVRFDDRAHLEVGPAPEQKARASTARESA